MNYNIPSSDFMNYMKQNARDLKISEVELSHRIFLGKHQGQHISLPLPAYYIEELISQDLKPSGPVVLMDGLASIVWWSLIKNWDATAGDFFVAKRVWDVMPPELKEKFGFFNYSCTSERHQTVREVCVLDFYEIYQSSQECLDCLQKIDGQELDVYFNFVPYSGFKNFSSKDTLESFMNGVIKMGGIRFLDKDFFIEKSSFKETSFHLHLNPMFIGYSAIEVMLLGKSGHSLTLDEKTNHKKISSHGLYPHLKLDLYKGILETTKNTNFSLKKIKAEHFYSLDMVDCLRSYLLKSKTW
jgi:hypothetical protein